MIMGVSNAIIQTIQSSNAFYSYLSINGDESLI